METERRQSGVRRNLNDLVRGDDGRISGSKIGTYAGQYLAGRALYLYTDDLIAHWDSLAVMFLVLIAPEMLKRIMAMKYIGGSEQGSSFTKTTDTHIEEEKKQDVPHPS